MSDSGREGFVTEEEGKRHYEDVIAPAEQEMLRTWTQQKDEFRRLTKIRRREVRRDTGGLMKTRMDITEIVFPNGKTKEVYRENVATEIDAEVARNNPRPVVRSYDTWWASLKSGSERGWRAELITTDGTETLELSDQNWTSGYPMSSVVRLLDGLTQRGWSIVHVSEDHGIYRGVDAFTEAYPTRVRYLLRHYP